MRDVKRRMERFSFYDHTGIEAHLERMAEKGWMLEAMPYLWRYRRCEPQKRKFCVTYYPRASAFDPEPTEGELDFQAYCERTGWKLAASNAQLQIFYNERQDATPIETDPLTEVETLHRTAKRSFLPSYFVLFALGLLQLWLFAGQVVRDPVELLSSPLRLFTGVCWAVLLLLTGVTLFGYFRWRRRALRAAERGEFLPTPNHTRFQTVCLAVVLAALADWLIHLVWQGDRLMKVVFLLMTVWMAALFFITRGIMAFLKRRRVSKNVNRAVTIGTAYVLGFLMLGGIVFGTIAATNRGLLPIGTDEDTATYEHNGQVWYLYRDSMPLRVEDLVDLDYDGYITRYTGDDSLFLSRYEAEQHPRFDAENFKDIPTLEYTVVSVKVPFLYGWCRDALYHGGDDNAEIFHYAYVSRDPTPWGANEMWERMDLDDGYSWNQFLLCYDSRLVEISFDWAPTEEQMAVVGKKLGLGDEQGKSK